MAYIVDKKIPIEFISELSKREANSKKPIYQIHKWFARKTDAIFRSLLLSLVLQEDELDSFKQIYYHSNEEKLKGKIILDPFAGGGTTLVNSLRLGAKTIGIDINPMSWFIIKNELQLPEGEKEKTLLELKKAFAMLETSIGQDIKKAYKTRIFIEEEKCYKEVDMLYVFWVKKCNCIKCGKEIKIFPKYKLTNLKKRNFENYSICPKCGEIIRGNKEIIKCNSCQHSFDPLSGSYKGRSIICPDCGCKFNIINDILKPSNELLPLEMYAIEYYDSESKSKGFKKPDIEDILAYEYYVNKAKELIESNNSLIPKTMVPEGHNTHQIINHNYRYWYQMFNYRQLYFLSKLLERINELENEIVRELFLCIFSNSLNANNMFCIYNSHCDKLEPLFGDHHMAPVMNPVENNLWGSRLGRGSFVKYYASLLESKLFNYEPYERVYENKKNRNNYVPDEAFRAKFCSSFEELTESEANSMLKCASSENLSFIPNQSIDAVVTDPPYYGAINYGEITEFFYSWCRLCLCSNYDFFKSEHICRDKEVTVNEKLGATKEEFISRLNRCFKEVKRVLKPGGLLVLTYNNSSAEGWGVMLKSLLQAGFLIVQTYPVHAELRAGLIDNRRDKMNYDLILVAKPKENKINLHISWQQFMEEVSEGFELVHRRLEGENLNTIDKQLIQAGKVFEIYSKYYPNIYRESNMITIDEALEEIYK